MRIFCFDSIFAFFSIAHSKCGQKFYYVGIERGASDLNPVSIENACKARGTSGLLYENSNCLGPFLLSLQSRNNFRYTWTGTCSAGKCIMYQGRNVGNILVTSSAGSRVRYGICESKKRFRDNKIHLPFD